MKLWGTILIVLTAMSISAQGIGITSNSWFYSQFDDFHPITIRESGHVLRLGFHSDITTNEPGYWEREKMWREMKAIRLTNYFGAIYATNYSYFTQPFPRTNINEQSFEVYSNTYALAVCDGSTNTLSEAHVKLGDWKTKSTTVIVTATNTVSSETYTPVK